MFNLDQELQCSGIYLAYTQLLCDPLHTPKSLQGIFWRSLGTTEVVVPYFSGSQHSKFLGVLPALHVSSTTSASLSLSIEQPCPDDTLWYWPLISVSTAWHHTTNSFKFVYMFIFFRGPYPVVLKAYFYFCLQPLLLAGTGESYRVPSHQLSSAQASILPAILLFQHSSTTNS